MTDDSVIPEGMIDPDYVITLTRGDGVQINCALISVIDDAIPGKQLAVLLQLSEGEEEGVDLVLMEFVPVDDETFDLRLLEDDEYQLAAMAAKCLVEELSQEPFTVMSEVPLVGEA